MSKKKYCLVGTGGRGISMFAKPLVKEYGDVAELVGFCDINSVRMKYAVKVVDKDVPCYKDFNQMLDEVDCDAVIVTSKDSTHHEYIIAALRRGKDVITEKPMTIDDEKCLAILKAEQETGKKVTVTFNYRFAPYTTKVKELVKSGLVGDVYSVDFHWYLDTVHGADYYRRWHRYKENSGGLMVHKSTHHFDMVNWIVEQRPELVFGFGSRNFYGDKGSLRSERCLTCPVKEQCNFHFDLASSERGKELYLSAEHEDGYFRDRCVFAEDIDIEDTMSVLVKYNKGVQLTYSLHSYLPFEGWEMAINGSKGRLECGVKETYVTEESPNFAKRCSVRHSMDWHKAAEGKLEVLTSDPIRFYPMFGGVENIELERATGGHGGGDTRLLDMLFREGVADPLGHMAGSIDGAMSIMVGIAANKAFETGEVQNIRKLLGEFYKE